VFRSIFTGVILILLGSTLVFADAGTVLVFPFENQSSDRNLDWIGEGIADLIIERLQAEPGLYVFQRDERLSGFEKLGIPESATISRATAMKLGWDTGSDHVITGRFSGTAEKFDIFARITTLSSSGASQEIKVSGKLDDVIPLATALSWQLLKIVVPGTKTPESDYISRPPIPRSAFENYIRGILSSDPKRRDEYFESAIRLRPNYAAAIFQLGRSKYFEGDFKLSNLLLEKMPAGDPYYLPAMFIVGMNDYRLADFAHSAFVFGMLPRSYDVLVNLGAALMEKGEPLNAIAAWREAANRDPYGIEATFNIGYASFVRGDLDGAVKGLEQTLRLQGRDNEAMFLLARAYERLGRIEESQKMMTQATRQSPRTERWLTQPLPKLTRLRTMPSLAAVQGLDTIRTWSAERLVRRAKGQDLPAWLDFIQNQVDSQQYGDALRELKEVRMVYPDSSEAHVLLGEVFERQRSYEQAVAEYQASIALRPAAETFVMMARVYKTLNQTTFALKAVEQALKLDPDHAAAKTLKAELSKSPPKRGKS
jgi:tetratricopeptide (TPR) repeat protein/TolB-like protein